MHVHQRRPQLTLLFALALALSIAAIMSPIAHALGEIAPVATSRLTANKRPQDLEPSVGQALATDENGQTYDPATNDRITPKPPRQVPRPPSSPVLVPPPPRLNETLTSDSTNTPETAQLTESTTAEGNTTAPIRVPDLLPGTCLTDTDCSTDAVCSQDTGKCVERPVPASDSQLGPPPAEELVPTTVAYVLGISAGALGIVSMGVYLLRKRLVRPSRDFRNRHGSPNNKAANPFVDGWGASEWSAHRV